MQSIRRGPLWRKIEMLHRPALYPLPVIIVPCPIVAGYRAYLLARVVQRRTKFGKTATAVCDEFGLSYEQLTGRSKVPEIVLPRQIAMHLMARDQGDRSVAALFKRDHTCVRLANRKIPKMASESQAFARRLDNIAAAIAA